MNALVEMTAAEKTEYNRKVQQACQYIRLDGQTLPIRSRRGTLIFYIQADAFWFMEEVGVQPNIYPSGDGRVVFEFPRE